MGKKTSADELVEAMAGTKKTKNKKGNNMKKTVILTVVATVAVIALFAGTFYAGIKYQQRYDKGVEAKAHAIAKQQASVKVEASKQ